MKQLFFLALRLLGVNALFRRLNRGRIKVLLYHHVIGDHTAFENAVTAEEFREQLRHLGRHYTIVALTAEGHWQGYDADRVNILVTFDDGFIDNLTEALPILGEHRVRALFFVIAECARTGCPPAFASRYAAAAADQLCTIGPPDIATLIEAGMTIGSHSLAHRDFRTLSDEQALDDARRSQAMLEEIGGKPVGSFAFPWGYFSQGQPQLMTDVYERVFLTEHGFCSPEDRVVPRNEVATLLHLEAAASGSLDFFRSMLAR